MSKVKCDICPWNCLLEQGQRGFCGVRGNVDDRIINVNYGLLAVASLDPVEKKPFQKFHPGKKILSIGANGCNMRCPHCQNFRFSMAAQEEIEMMDTDPKEVVETAVSYKDAGNIGIAFTFNEPVTMYDFMMNTAKLAKKNDLLTAMITNGYISEEPLRKLLPYIDAMNIDLKYFNEDGYKKIGGNLETVKKTIEIASKECHVEISWLVVPGENDSIEELEEAAKWLASVNSEIPLHISRFFPMYKVLDKCATEKELMYKLQDVAKEYLENVYLGNMF